MKLHELHDLQEDPIDESWKKKAAAGALAGAVALGAQSAPYYPSLSKELAKGTTGNVAAKVVDADSREADEAFMAKIPAGSDRDAYNMSMKKMRMFRAMSITKPTHLLAAKIAKKKHKALHDELAAKYKLSEGRIAKVVPAWIQSTED